MSVEDITLWIGVGSIVTIIILELIDIGASEQ